MLNGIYLLLASLLVSQLVLGGYVHANPLVSRAEPDAIKSVASGIKIDSILSNYWNNTQFLAQTHPSIDFLTGGKFTGVSINSTKTTPDIVGIEVEENRAFQTMLGYGAGISDATAITLQGLKTTHRVAYDEILNLAFNDSPEWAKKGGAAMNMVRVPIGASDFGYTEYTYADVADGSDDVDLKLFNIEKSPKRWATLQDITAIRPDLVIMATPWSPPAWMKGNDNGSLHGGSLLEKYEGPFADYLVRFVKDLYEKKSLKVSVLSLQNEPLYDGAVYPCMKMEAPQQARVGKLVRKKLDAAGYPKVGLLAYDHNWDQLQYPIDVLDDADQDTFMGAAWHCYGGDPKGQRPFNDAYPNKQVWFTECTRITQFFEEPWINTRKQFRDLITGSINYNAMSLILWNLALIVTEEGYTRPSLPQTCRNCLSPFQILLNATDGTLLQGMNMDIIKASETGSDPSSVGSALSARDTRGG
jgi:O-glycosyl hydrolase